MRPYTAAWRLPMWSSPSRCESTASIPVHQNPFTVLVNVPENVACTGGFQCGAHPHDVRVLPVSLLIKIHSLRFLISLKISLAHALRANHLKCRLSSCLLQNKYACAMIETGTRHTIPICACTKPEGRGYPAKLSSLLAHFKCETCAVTLGARTYYASKCVQDKGYHTKRRQESEVILTSTTTNTLAL